MGAFDVSLVASTMLLQIITGLVSVNPLHDTNPLNIHDELFCLALNSYHEARGESFDDKMATAQVVINRVDSPKYPDDVCSVISQGPVTESWKTRKQKDLAPEDRVYYPVRNRCQFSWYCDGKPDNVSTISGWEDSILAAYLVFTGYGEDLVYGATHYYAHASVNPVWAKSMVVTRKLKGHTYLKEK